jgi:hypothetical protein
MSKRRSHLQAIPQVAKRTISPTTSVPLNMPAQTHFAHRLSW